MAAGKSETEEPDRWFLEVRSQISGPFNGIKILERLLKDEISVKSRVSRDRKTWAAICNTPFFEELVNYRIRVYSGESGNVGQMKPGGDDEEFELDEVFGLHGATDGISEQLEHARQLEELTANIQKLNALRKEILHQRKTVFVEKESDLDDVHPDDQNVFVPVEPKKASWRDLFTTTDPVHRRRMVYLLGFIVVGVLATQGYSYFTTRADQSADKAKLKQAIEAQASGDYAKAMAAFKGIKASSLSSTDFASAKQLLDLADAHIAGKDPKTGQLLLKQVMAMKLGPADAARAHALQSVIAMQSGNLEQATVELEASLKQSEIYSTLHNLAIIKLKMKKPDEAEPLLLKALQVAGKTPGLDTGATAIALFQSAYELDHADHETSLKAPPVEGTPSFRFKRLETVAQLLDLQLKTTELRQETYLAAAVTRFVLGQREAFQLLAYELIDNPVDKNEPRIKQDLNYDLTHWPHLVHFCTEIYNQPKSGNFVAAFYAACLWRSHGAAQALPFAKYALSLRPQDAVYAGLTASLLIELKKNDEAKKLLFVDGKPITGSKLAAAAVESLASEASTTTTTAEPSPTPEAKP